MADATSGVQRIERAGDGGHMRRRGQVAKATDCKSVIPGSNPGAASIFSTRGSDPARRGGSVVAREFAEFGFELLESVECVLPRAPVASA